MKELRIRPSLSVIILVLLKISLGIPWWSSDQDLALSCHDQGSVPVYVYSIVSDSLPPHELQPARFLWLWDFPSKYTGVGCRFLFQGLFLTQGSNPCFLPSSALGGRFFTTAPPGKPFQENQDAISGVVWPKNFKNKNQLMFTQHINFDF